MYVLREVFLVPIVVGVGDVHLVVESGYLFDALLLYGVGDLQDYLAWVQLAEFLDDAAERSASVAEVVADFDAFACLEIFGILDTETTEAAS